MLTTLIGDDKANAPARGDELSPATGVKAG
jgi:hypothetical protein